MNWEREFLSRPRPVYWAGWESNTHRLQQAGWQFAAEEDFTDFRTRIIMRHEPLRMHAISEFQETDFIRAREDMRYAREGMPFHVNYMASHFQVMLNGGFDPGAFRPVDMQPQIVTAREIKDIEDLSLFAAPMARTNEVIVDPHSVPELMNRILELQEPGRQEYFRQKAAEMRRDREKFQPRQQFHAQVLSLVA